MKEDRQPQKVLLVEDHDGDAQLLLEHLSDSDGMPFDVTHVSSLEAALEYLLPKPVLDVVVLDLALPDSRGVATLSAVQKQAPNVPVVVIAGNADQEIGERCIELGAQDHLHKSELASRSLRRTIHYAVLRRNEALLAEHRRTLSAYRNLSSATQQTGVTAALAGSGAVALRSPDTFQSAVDLYATLLAQQLEPRLDPPPSHRAPMERVVTIIGGANGGPRDLLDVHVAALEHVFERVPNAGAFVYEARLVALEMMGLLVDYYRVGYRRVFS